MSRVTHTILAGMVGLSLLANDFAEAATCYTMQAELAHLRGEGGGGAGGRARYERAFREQANVLARTERRARSAGCFGGGFLFFRRRQDSACGQLLPKVRAMQDNLAKLDRQRRRGGAGANNTRRIRQLQAAIAARGCGVPGRDSFEAPRRADRFDNYSRGTYRTLCVRTCDGYYFPISYATTPRQFGADAQTCAAMCPATEAKLYAHRNPGGGPEDMQAIEGGYYTDLATAFRYRTALDPLCTCKPAGGITTAFTGRPALDPAAIDDGTPPPPNPRPEPGEDPETLANRAGHFVPRAGAAAAEATLAAAPSGERGIRVVGPPHWGAKGKDSVVLTPVPNPATARRRAVDPDRS